MQNNVLVCNDRLLADCFCSNGTLVRNDTQVFCTTQNVTYRCERKSLYSTVMESIFSVLWQPYL